MGQLPPRLLSVGIIAAALTFILLLIPASANTCIVGCHGMQGGKGYAEGNTYSYGFEGTSVTAVSEAQGDSTVKLSANVELSVKPDCVRQLKLKNVLLNGTPISQKDVEQYALQFNYHNGHIDTSVCTEPHDSQASLNIKRAIASLFQTAVMQDSGVTMHRETDVFGNCETNFEFRTEGDKLTVHKRKNLSNCSHREHLRHGLLYSTYDGSSDIQTSPIVDSHQEIEQILENGILNSVKSTETYIYRPFTNGEAGAKTVIHSKLILKSSSADGQSKALVSIPKSLIFEAPHPVVESSAEAIINSLKAIKETSKPEEIKNGAAEKFGDLIKVLRKSNKNDIISVYQKLKAGASGFDKNYDKKILLDALYRTGTGEAAEVAVYLIKNKELDDYEKMAYLASLSLVDHVNLPAVTAVVTLLDEKDVPRIGYLGIGNIIGKYCRDHECDNVAEVKAALAKISSKIHQNNGIPKNRKNENEIIASFKALGNAKYLDKETVEKMVKIINDKTIHNRVRVSAIEALPAKCSVEWTNPILDIFANREEDSEVRIKAYLSLIACPSATVANRIKEIIDKETVNQVGSFVTSHLKNLRASTDPSKTNAKKYFQEIRPRNKFPIDYRKFSFNNELSYKIDKFGIGSTIEQNIIYSQKSWLPRSTNLNLTTEIFGRSFNFLEIDTRIENLDKLIEHYFGPKGIIRHSDIADLIVNGKNTFSNVYGRVKERMEKIGRGRRAALNYGDVEKFSKNIKSTKYEDTLDDDVDIDISVKMFGLELAFMDLKDSNVNDNDKSTSTIDKIFKYIDEALNNAKNFDYSVSKHLHFMDIDIIYPTGLGFPLSIGIEGNGVTNVKSSGKIDLKSIIKDPKNAVIKIGLEPSASISIAGSLTIDTFGIENGLKVIGDIHTSTGSDVSLRLLDGNGFDINFGIPKRKQEIISVSSKVIFIDKNGLKTPVKFTKGKEHSDCFDQFSTILGLTICGHFSFPYESLGSIDKRPFFPISGPAKFALSIENTDATSYHLRAFYDKSKDNYKSMEILFETPNSRNNRKVLLRIEGSNEPTKKYIRAVFDSPLKYADGQLAIENSDKKKAFTVTLKHDKDNYYGSIGIVANGNKYKPILEYKIPEHIEKLAVGGKAAGEAAAAAYKLDGDIIVNDQDQMMKKYIFEKITLFVHGKKLASLDGSVLSGTRLLVVDANIAHKDENFHLKFDGKFNDHGLDVNLAVVPFKNPNIGFQLVWHYDLTNEKIDHNFIFTYGADLQSKINRFTFTEHVTYKKNNNQRSTDYAYVPLTAFKCKSEITWPAQNFHAKLENQLSTHHCETEINLHYGKFKFGTEMEIKIDETNPSNWQFEFDTYLIDSKLSLSAKHEKMTAYKRKIEGKFEIPGAKYEGEAITLYHVEGHNANIGLESKFKLNGKKIEVNYDFEMNPQKLNSHALVSFDNTKYLEYLLEGTRGAKPHGKLTLIMKKILIIAGQFTYENGKGSSSIDIELPRFERKIKGNGALTISGTHHIASIEVLLDAERDPNKRIKLSSDSDLTKTSIDTKNIIEILSYKVEINGKGKFIDNNKSGRDLEGTFDLLLPNGRYFIVNGKGKAIRAADKTLISGKYELLDHQNKGGQSRKIGYEYDLAMTEPKHDNVEAKHNLLLANYDDKNLQITFATKYTGSPIVDGAINKADIQFIASGSYLPKELKFIFSSDKETKDKASWKLDSSFGNDLTINAGGNHLNGYYENKPSIADISIALQLPNEKLRNLKYHGKISLLLPNENINDFEYTTIQTLTYNDDKTISGDINIRANGFQQPGEIKKESTGKLKLVILQHSPLIINGNIKYDPSGEIKRGDGSIVVNYGDKKVALNFDSTYKLDLSHIGMNIKATTPAEKLHNVEFGFERNAVNKKINDNGALNKYNVHLIADGKKYDVSSEFEINDKKFNRVDMIFTCPEGKTEIHSMMNIIGENEYKGDWKVVTPKGFAVADGHLKFENIDDFIIDFNFDSDKIKERKIHAEIASKPAIKTGKRIIITVTSDGKNIITGSTNYNKRDEVDKVIVEGSGNLKIGDNTRSSKFMYSRKQLRRNNDGETGVVIMLNANFGPSAVVGEFKLSDKEINILNSFCEKSKDCAHFKLRSILDSDRETRMNHQITLEVDLKKFYVPVEFGLKITSKYQPKELTFDHTANLYLHTSKDKTQYSSHIYMNIDETGVVLTVPNREFALITIINVPKSKIPVGPFKIDLSVYLDRKNHPNDKTSFIANGDIIGDKNSAGISGEVRFIHPGQTKDMMVKGKIYTGNEYYLDANVDFDVFAKKTQKITVAAQLFKRQMEKGYNITGLVDVTSRGQQLKVNLKNNLAVSSSEMGFETSLSYNDKNQKAKTVGVFFNANAKQINLKIQGPNKYLLQSDSTIELSKNKQMIESKYQIVDNPTVVVSIEAHDFNNFKYQSYQQDKPDNKLIVSGRAVIGQVGEIHADAMINGEKKNLFNIAIYLDENRFLKPNFAYNKDNIVYMIDLYREKLLKYAEILKEAGKQVNDEASIEFKDLIDHLKKSQSNWRPMIEYYQKELIKLKEEINNDKILHEIIDAYSKVFGGITTAIVQIIKQLTEHIEQLHKQFNEIMEKLCEAIKSTSPRIKESIDKIAKAALEIIDAASKLAATYVKAIINIINEHQKELKELIKLMSEIAHDIIKILSKGIKQIEADVKNFITMVSQQIKALPINEFFSSLTKYKWSDISNYKIPEGILMPIEEAFVQLTKLLPTEELRQFVTITYNYLMKLIKHESVDEQMEIKNIYTHGIDALRSIIALIQHQDINNHEFFGIFGDNLLANLHYIRNIAGLPILKLSIINVIRNGELPSISDLYYTYRPTGHTYSDIIPPFSKMAIVVEGGHFFTFDGRHLTMAGTCDYILAHDTHNGNFTIIGSFNGGKFISLTIVAPSESITLKSNGNILVDDKPAEYPANTKNLHAFLTPPIVNVKSDYGIHVACSQKTPMICSVYVSGFYHGKLRGIFGDANNEPYDDLTLPTNHITENESDFANAYRLNSACTIAPAIDHHETHARNPTCTSYFTDTSSMSSCFNYVNPMAFRQACDHATAAGTPRAACLISAAYYAACRKQGIAISIPTECGACKVGKDKNVAIGDNFSVKIPNKEADIVFFIEQNTKNDKIYHDFIVPLMAEVKNEFKHYGINDIHIGLIGYGEDMKWPQHYTTGGSANINGEVKNIKFSEANSPITFKQAKEGDVKTRLNYAKQRIDVELGTFAITDAYEEAIRYPFRIGSAKAVVGIIATPCEKSPLPLSLQQVRLFMGQKAYRDLGLTYHHIGFLNDILVSGKMQKNVVGYDSTAAYTLADSKNKPLQGSIDKNNLVLTSNDVCAGFAVSSGGAAFSSNHFLEAKPNQQKQFIQVTARRIVDGMANVQLQEDCICKQQSGLNGHANCKIVGRKEKESLGRHAKDSVKG
ncbi:apolipophorins [Diachasma alloeum]|uniref:apolipophorins n=1 Tax=Diachasma alloeum TaxID=454923 RepID=UPI0007383E58|nr:apolipophorins [Diachasma alloeum]